jgi:hypothetical protein
LPYEAERRTTVYISTCNLSPKEGKISQAQKRRHLKNGEDAVDAFLQNK